MLVRNLKFKESVTLFKFRIRLSHFLTYLGLCPVASKIICKVHYKHRHYKHQYKNIGIWKYIMKLY